MPLIYSLEESAEITNRTQAQLIELGCAGSIKLFVYAPDDAKIGNVRWVDIGESQNSPEGTSLWNVKKTLRESPIWEPEIELLGLSSHDCQILRECGRLRQEIFGVAAAFNRSATFGRKTQLVLMHPQASRNVSKEDGKFYSPTRVFAVYDRNVAAQNNSFSLPKKMRISPSDVYISAQDLHVLQNKAENLVTTKSHSPTDKRKGKSIDELSRLIKRKVYDPASAEDKEKDDVLWEKLLSLAEQSSSEPLLIEAVKGRLRYWGSDEKEKELTYKKFYGRLKTIRLLGQ